MAFTIADAMPRNKYGETSFGERLQNILVKKHGHRERRDFVAQAKNNLAAFAYDVGIDHSIWANQPVLPRAVTHAADSAYARGVGVLYAGCALLQNCTEKWALA